MEKATLQELLESRLKDIFFDRDRRSFTARIVFSSS